MRRPVTLLGVVAVAAVIAIAGYLGYQSSNKQPRTAIVKPPTTVAVTRGDVQRTVSAPCQLINTREMVLGMKVAGQLADINVRPGDHVTGGQRLATLDTANLRNAAQQEYANYVVAQADYSQSVKGPTPAELSAARADLSGAQAAYSDLYKPPSDNQVASLKATLQNAQATVRRAQAAYDRAYAANPAGIGGAPEGLELEKATNDFEAARANYDKAFEPAKTADVQGALARIADARAKLAALAPVTETIQQAKAKLDKAYLSWQQAEANVQLATLTVPHDGVVLEVKARVGDTLAAGAGLIVISDPAAVEVKASVLEEDLMAVREGQSVQVFFDAAPEAIVQGRVHRIVPQRIEGDRALFPVYISLDNLPQGLAAGMTVDDSIIIATAPNVLRLPRALVRAGSGNTAQVEVWADNQRQPRTVKIGLRGDTFVEIVDGLSEGEEVVGE